MHVSSVCEQFATYLTLRERHVWLLRVAGRLHDIGVAFIKPQTLWTSSERWLPEERALGNEHARKGALFLTRFPPLFEVGVIVGESHERFDGTGFPRGLAAWKTHPLSRMLVIADAFCAMTQPSWPHSAKSEEEALREITQGAGASFDPVLVRLFCQLRGSAGDVVA